MISREEYLNQKSLIRSSIFAEWSDPLYQCPRCNEGGMCQNLRCGEVIATNPPIYKHAYRCNKCGFVETLED